VATFPGTNGKSVKVSLKGPGQGFVTILDNGAAQVDVTGSTDASSLNMIGGSATLDTVTINGSLKSFTGKAADLGGNVSVTGNLGKFTAHNASGGHSLNIGGTTAATSITLASASDLSIVSASPIKSIKTAAWVNSDSTPDTLDAPTLLSLSVKGNMGASLHVGTLGKVSVGGAITGATIRSDGDIASIRAGAMHDSAVYAGVRSDLTGLPTVAGDFTHDALIKSLSVRGKTAGSFSNTMIAAQDLGKISLGSVATTNNGTPFGVGADRVAAVSATAGSGGKVSLKKLDAPTDSQTQDDFNLRLI